VGQLGRSLIGDPWSKRRWAPESWYTRRERIFDGVESFGFEPVEVLHSPLATHIRYRRAG
jgi:hypothetical protein